MNFWYACVAVQFIEVQASFWVTLGWLCFMFSQIVFFQEGWPDLQGALLDWTVMKEGADDWRYCVLQEHSPPGAGPTLHQPQEPGHQGRTSPSKGNRLLCARQASSQGRTLLQLVAKCCVPDIRLRWSSVICHVKFDKLYRAWDVVWYL